MAETSRQRASKRLSRLKEERSTWDPSYRQLAENFLPRKSRWLMDAGEANRNSNRHTKVIDGSPIFAARTLASGMLAGVSSPSRPWVRFITEDEDLMEYGPVKEWLEFVQKRMMAVLAKSNFYNVLGSVYGEWGVFGTASMMILPHPKDVISSRCYTAGSYFLSQNASEEVDTFAYKGKMQVRQLHQEFKGKLSAQSQAAYTSGQLDNWVDVVHLIEPNEDAQYGRQDNRNMPFASCWYEEGNGDGFLRESGFEEFPVMAPRWSRTGEDVYGSSPAMDALGDAKQLQHQSKQKAKQVDKMTDPPMWATPELKTQKSSLLPGDLTYATPVGQSAGVPFQPVYVPHPAGLVAVREDLLTIAQRIDRAMYVDLFLMLATSSATRQVTAEEIARRYEEKVLMLDPVLTQANKELLNPAIDRVFYVMARAGQFPPPPPELEGTTFKPDYISILAQAQRMVTTGAIQQTAAFVGQIAKFQADSGEPVTVFDKFDPDQAVDEFSVALGAPAKIIRSDDVVAKLRAKRAQQQQAQQAAAMAKPAADAAGAVRDLAEARATAQGA